MAESGWSFGSGGKCGEAFDATRVKILGDIKDHGGIRDALEYWRRTGYLGEWARIGEGGVLTEDDVKRMERAIRDAATLATRAERVRRDGDRRDGC